MSVVVMTSWLTSFWTCDEVTCSLTEVVESRSRVALARRFGAVCLSGSRPACAPSFGSCITGRGWA
jgi:hypothetical protein